MPMACPDADLPVSNGGIWSHCCAHCAGTHLWQVPRNTGLQPVLACCRDAHSKHKNAIGFAFLGVSLVELLLSRHAEVGSCSPASWSPLNLIPKQALGCWLCPSSLSPCQGMCVFGVHLLPHLLSECLFPMKQSQPRGLGAAHSSFKPDRTPTLVRWLYSGSALGGIPGKSGGRRC